jgi:uncharacterized protein (TIGR02611 family)
MGMKPVALPSASLPEAGAVPTRVNEMPRGEPANDSSPAVDPAATDSGAAPAANRSPAAEPARPHGVAAWLHRTLEPVRAHPTGRVALKVTVGALGALVVAVGIALIPLPGPGWAIVILGLAIWAIEFVWARHLLRFTRRHVQSWTHWIARQSLPLRLVIGAVGIVFVSAVVWLSVKLSVGVDLYVLTRDFVASR